MEQENKHILILEDIAARIIKEIDSDLEALNPDTVDKYRLALTSLYAFFAEELARIDKRYPSIFTKLREETTSDKQAEMLYNQTEDGQRKIELKATLKWIEKMIGALRDRLKRLNDERHQSYGT